ncbi:hypothetical protein AOQ84DRAFT_340907 [Glonium stellatum]|uniref:Uncharacterized protein n=1 Tax=Glonium stellatum TaxID=574774 RepID=A0A8E2F017_9PEZI|nr:hypothetical protein AOQ84DRAFT_340907 [Glonium stellatum]
MAQEQVLPTRCGLPPLVTPAERERQRELASYFSAASVTLAQYTPTTLSQPRISPDAVLTALAQLGAVRLGCDRAFISLIDGRHQYIIAEATRTVSIRDPDCYSPEDAIYLGMQTLDITFGVCPNTMNVFTDRTGELEINSENIMADKTRYIIRDFQADAHYRTRPYVKGWPHMRYYAEVPLICPRGYVIGSYCVVDNKLRDDFNEESFRILTEVSLTIMDHLELMKTRHNHSRAEKLMEGLGSFMGGDSCLNTVNLAPLGSERSTEDNVEPAYNPTLDCASCDAANPSEGLRSSSTRTPSVLSSSDGSAPPETPLTTTSNPQSSTSSRNPELWASSSSLNGQNSLDRVDAARRSLQESAVSDEMRRTFCYAASVIRKSMRIDGVVFLDACLAQSNIFTTLKTPTAPGLVDAPIPNGEVYHIDNGTQSMSAKLGFSTSSGDSIAKNESSKDCPNLPEPLLQRMIRIYPRGQIFSADEFGPLSPWTDKYGDDIPIRTPDLSEEPPIESLQRKMDIARMFELFQGARSIIFLPLWDFQRERWFATALGWTTDPERLFEAADLTYLSAFGNSIMAEIARFEALATSRAKSDFISSISHELRSPLHGILASVELLREALTLPPGSSAVDMIDMIESCGNTLLDTLTNLLDFAKINHLVQSQPHKDSIVSGDNEQKGPRIDISLPVDLGLLVEDVVEGVYLGHFSKRSFNTELPNQDWIPSHTQSRLPKETNNARPLVTFDISSMDWLININVGAWKRIVMNIFGNALKYTSTGHIQVGLRLENLEGESDVPANAICFEVIDTGIGMSADYLKHRLFTPFAQENSLTVGTGLGLSIVHQIVRNLNGKVEVKSELEVGTHVKVLVPLGSRTDEIHSTSPDNIKYPAFDPDKQLSGQTLCIMLPDLDHESSQIPKVDPTHSSVKRNPNLAIETSLCKMATEWFGMKVVLGNSIGYVSADVYIVEDSLLDDIATARIPTSTEGISTREKIAPVLVLCYKSRTRATDFKVDGKELIYLRHPIGPKKLFTVICNAISSIRMPKPQSTSISPSDDDQEQSKEVSDVATLPSAIAQITITESTSMSLKEPSSPDARDAQKIGTKPSDQLFPHRQHVLCVDDNAINLKIITTAVSKLDCTHVAASDGLQAVQAYKASTRSFDYVFMDVNMPVMDGFAATRAIRLFEQENQLPPSRIIALTGLGSAASQQEALSCGMDLFLTKPVPMKRLRSLIQGHNDEKSHDQRNDLVIRHPAQPTNTRGFG